jgi:hypothetical protein
MEERNKKKWCASIESFASAHVASILASFCLICASGRDSRVYIEQDLLLATANFCIVDFSICLIVGCVSQSRLSRLYVEEYPSDLSFSSEYRIIDWPVVLCMLRQQFGIYM